MGRYRELIAAIVLHGNSVSRTMFCRVPGPFGIALNQQEWQILETLVDDGQSDSCMCRLSERLGIPQSSLSKAVKNLCAMGLVERYHKSGNRKNVILRATEAGRRQYAAFCGTVRDAFFDGFFAALDPLDDESIRAFSRAMASLGRALEKQEDPDALIPLSSPEEIRAVGSGAAEPD